MIIFEFFWTTFETSIIFSTFKRVCEAFKDTYVWSGRFHRIRQDVYYVMTLDYDACVTFDHF